MTEKIIQGAINNLINETKKVLIPNSITTLTANLSDASKNQDFYKIDYLKYAKQIIDNSNLSPEIKEEIRQKFKKPPPAKPKRCSDIIKDKVVFFSEPEQPTTKKTTPPPVKIQSSAPNLVNRNVANYNELIANPPVYRKTKYCTACKNPIEYECLAYYLGYPYHNYCIKCMKCSDSVNESRPKTVDNYVSITKGLFLCHQHYDEYRGLKQLPNEIGNIYHQKNKENFVKELFSIPLNEEIINELEEEEEEDKYEIITPEIIKESIPIKRPYEDFLPIITFRFDKIPTEINYDELQKIFGSDFIIISVEKGSSIIKAAFVADVYNNDLSKCDLIKKKSNFILKQLNSTMGKGVVGNIVDEPTYTLPDNKKINEEYNKPYLNALQNIHELDKMDFNFMKKTAADILINDCCKKNWSFIFEHENLYEDLEKQILKDLSDNDFELIIVAQTVITNKNIDTFYKIASKIKQSNKKQIFLYHGTRLENHQKIVKNHFLMPGKDKIIKKTDSGFFGKGIYATEDIFYASFYANGCEFLNFNQKAHVICCMAIYNNSKVVELHDLSFFAQEMNDDIKSNYGIHHTFVGSSKKFQPIQEKEKQVNYVSAEEFVFGNKYQIIPIYSFTIMRKDHFILWKDENLDTDENQEYLKELSLKTQVNVYNTKSVDQALDVIKKKKRNKFKMITNGGGRNETGRKLIIGARNIIMSDFVCLVFALDSIHMKWVKKMTNVLFTTSPDDFRKFVNLRLDENDIYNFAIELQNKYGYKFKLDKKNLLRFPTTSISSYEG